MKKLQPSSLQHFALFLFCVFSFNLKAADANEFSYGWISPKNQQPKLYEKIEWGLTLPPQINTFIDHWISNDQKLTKLNPTLNPFDPDQIDVSAVIEYVKDGKPVLQPVFGFFYRDYERITEENNPTHLPGMSDPDKWHWNELQNNYSFRIRWAADAETEYTVRISMKVPGIGNWEIDPFKFTCKGGELSKSFIAVSENKHYFKTDDNKVFIPVGLNLTEGSWGCNCRAGVEAIDNCEKCYEWGSKDPCCGLDVKKKQRMGIPGTKLMEYSLATAAYVKLHQVLETLSNSGANAFRTFLDPMAFDIEFEKLNNYYDRQYQAWELDRMLDDCRDMNLRVELNLQYHYSITYHSFGFDRFDWGDEYNCIGCGKDTKTTGTDGWCYNSQCPDVDDPVDFLTNECALKNYKKKIRYIIARWGYSPNIYVMELMSEMNNIGNGSEWEVNIDTDNDGQKDDVREHPIPSLYASDPKRTRAAVAFWHNEIARYIKEDLKHDRHLIAADYTGPAPMFADFNGDGDCLDAEIGENCNPCQSDYFDNSWMSQNIDVMAYSNYTGALNRWEKMAVQEYSKNSQSSGLMCGWNDPDTKDDDGKYHSALGSYESLWKPVIHAENGLTYCLDDDYTGFVKDILADVLGGHASSGMSWDEWSNTDKWYYMGMANKFLTQYVLDSTNIGKGNWIPNHSYSSRKGEFAKTKFAESIYLMSPEKDRYTGFVMNRTWNHYTQGTGGCKSDDMKNVFSGSDAPLAQFTELNPGTDRVFLKEAKNGKYVIQYIDPATNKVIKTTATKAKRGKLELTDYPSLGDGSKSAMPFYFYVVYPANGKFADM